MYREIKKKQIILENRKPYTKQIQDYIKELNKSDWICSSLRMDGSSLTKAQIEKIMKGEFFEDQPLSFHAQIDRYNNLFKASRRMLEMSFSFNKDLLLTFARILSGDDSIQYRRSNPVLLSLNYNPPHPSEIAEQIDILMTWFFSDDMEENKLRKAACLHHRIIEIYPFESVSEEVARAAMYYYLMENDYHPFDLNLSEVEYNVAVTEYLKNANVEPFYIAIEQSLLTKMEVLMQLTARA
jgi:Fic family protein